MSRAKNKWTSSRKTSPFSSVGSRMEAAGLSYGRSSTAERDGTYFISEWLPFFCLAAVFKKMKRVAWGASHSLTPPLLTYLLHFHSDCGPKERMKEAGRRIWRKVTHTHHTVHNFRRRSIDFPASAALDLTNRNCAANAKILKSSPGKESFGFFSFCRWCTYLQRVLLFKKRNQASRLLLLRYLLLLLLPPPPPSAIHTELSCSFRPRRRKIIYILTEQFFTIPSSLLLYFVPQYFLKEKDFFRIYIEIGPMIAFLPFFYLDIFFASLSICPCMAPIPLINFFNLELCGREEEGGKDSISTSLESECADRQTGQCRIE